MSGSNPVLNVSTLVPRGTAAGLVLIGYDPVADTFASVVPGALQGQQGPKGDTGATGIQGAQGIPGSAGTNGKTIIQGDGPPPSSVGSIGDYYFDRQNKFFYPAKQLNGWPEGFSIVGPQGPQGIQGPAGQDGVGGGGGSGNVTNGTQAGQIPVWDPGATSYMPTLGTPITGDRTPSVEINSATALTFVGHNRRNVVMSAVAPCTFAAAEAGTAPNQGFEAVVQNDHTAVNTITFGSGVAVKQPATGTGTGGVVKIAVDGTISVQVYPKGSGLVAKIKGDVV